MALEVFAEALQRVASGKRRVSGGSTVVQRGTIHSPHNLIKAAREKAAEEAAAAEERRKTNVARVEKAAAKAKDDQAAVVRLFELACRVCCSTRHRGGPAWLVCDCGRWRACPRCKSTQTASSSIAAHKEICSVEGGGESTKARGCAGPCSFLWPRLVSLLAHSRLQFVSKMQIFVAASEVVV